MLSRNKATNDQGFTLVELLVVIIIIGLLASIAIPIFLNNRKKAVDAGIKQDLSTVARNAEALAVAAPLSGAAFTAADFNTTMGFRKTDGNVVEIFGSRRDGFCVRGTNPYSNATDVASAAYWYDSAVGGLTSKPGAAPTGGACENATVWATLG